MENGREAGAGEEYPYIDNAKEEFKGESIISPQKKVLTQKSGRLGFEDEDVEKLS